MNILRKASHIGVVGRSGTGKTSYAERYIAGSHHGRVFIYDHQSEFATRLNIEPVFDFDGLIENAQEHRIVCFDPSENFGGYFAETFVAFCEWVFSIAKVIQRKYHLESLFCCDEVQKLVDPYKTPVELKEILQTGRRYALDTLLLSQQPHRVGNEIREQWTEIACFQLIDGNSLKFPELVGLDPEEISRLPAHNYHWVETHTGEKRAGVLQF